MECCELCLGRVSFIVDTLLGIGLFGHKAVRSIMARKVFCGSVLLVIMSAIIFSMCGYLVQRDKCSG